MDDQNLQNQNDQNNQDDNQNNVSIRVGGPEGGSIVLEQAALSSAESGQETAKPVERAQETSKESSGEKQQFSKPKPQPQKPEPKKEEKKKSDKPSGPPLYGYKVPVSIIKQMKKVPQKAKHADPKTGLGCLYMFLDRLLRMKP